MTDLEKEELRQAKQDVTERLDRTDVARYRLREVDSRIEDYCRAVINDPDGHNLWEQLSVQSFFRKIDRYGLSRVPVQRFFKMYETLYFPGKKGLTHYRLTPVQAYQFANVYGFWHPDGRRVVRECVLFVPRKFSKTTGTAAFAVHDLLYGDSNAEVYIGANSQDQAKKCFEVIRGSLARLDSRGKRYWINKEAIRPRSGNARQAFAQCLTSNARTKDGMNASTVIMDEFSQARDSELLTVLTTSMGVRENPLTVIITTASDVFDGPFYAMLQGYKEVLLGKFDDDSLFAHLFEPDVDDAENDPATWHKVHPHLGVTVQSDYYETEYRKAERNGAEAMLAFRTKLLNLYTVNEQKSWIPATRARDIARPATVEGIVGHPDAMAAIDLSVRGDFSAVSVGFYNSKNCTFGYITDYFFPEGALKGHVNERLYRTWASQGYLHLLPGDVIDHDQIVSHILLIAEHTNLLRIGFDPYKARDVVNILKTIGDARRVVPVSQTKGNFNAAVESFEHGVWTDHVWINDNPINYYCFGNAVLVEDNMENKKPEKRVETQRIDGVITMLMCHRLWLDEH